jgi:flavin-dependent dehydrogenase
VLVELGIQPRRIGVDDLHESRTVAWEREAFEESRGPVSAHVERPALDLALLDAVVTSGRVSITLSDHPDCFRAAIEAARRKQVRLIDATGRRSASARKKIQPAKPWAARTFLALRSSCGAHTDLRIAALAGGFTYRLGGDKYLVLGIIGRKETIMGDPLRLEQQLYESGAGWILEGLPSMGEMIPGKTAPASVQWTNEDVGVRIGDAALARDTLSSQGLAAGISEAFYAAAIKRDGDESLFSLRQVEQRLAHLRSLAELIGRCRFHDNETWQEYAEFVSEHAHYQQPESNVALRAGRITAC